jgi:hypothetical protein
VKKERKKGKEEEQTSAFKEILEQAKEAKGALPGLISSCLL